MHQCFNPVQKSIGLLLYSLKFIYTEVYPNFYEIYILSLQPKPTPPYSTIHWCKLTIISLSFSPGENDTSLHEKMIYTSTDADSHWCIKHSLHDEFSA